MEECGQHHVLAALPWGRALSCQLDGPRASLEQTENYLLVSGIKIMILESASHSLANLVTATIQKVQYSFKCYGRHKPYLSNYEFTISVEARTN